MAWIFIAIVRSDCFPCNRLTSSILNKLFMKKIQWLPILALMLSLNSCQVVGGIFKAGMGVGIFVVVIIIAVIFFIVRALGGGSK